MVPMMKFVPSCGASLMYGRSNVKAAIVRGTMMLSVRLWTTLPASRHKNHRSAHMTWLYEADRSGQTRLTRCSQQI